MDTIPRHTRRRLIVEDFERFNAVPVHQQLAEYLRKNIVNGILAPSSKLLSERDLALKFKVNRETLRKAIDRLCYEGLLVRRSGKGTFVANIKEKGSVEIKKIGLIVSWGDMVSIEKDSYYGQVFRGLRQNQPEHCELNAILYKKEIGLLDLFHNNNFEGMIIVAPRIEMKPELIRLKQAKIPSIIFNASFNNTILDCVDSDNTGGSMMAVEYLVSLKHKNIGYISGQLNDTNAVDRLKGYQIALKKYGLGYKKNAVSRDVNRLLDLRPRPTAILFYSCSQAMVAVEIIKKRGLNIPDDISIITFDDPEVASYTRPPLTVIKEPLFEMSKVALKELMRRITGSPRNSLQINLKTELIKRSSCACFYSG
jgi:DNA-binding LacI/PurR family transcriptional regulator